MTRTLLRLLAGLLIACGALSNASAQSWPSRPIRLVVPFPPGGPLDLQARVIGQKMGEAWGQAVIIDNRPGANTIIGAEAVARSAPDGYTLLMAVDSTLVMNQSLYAKLPYDPVKDFSPVSLTVWSPIVLVVDAATGPKTLKELVARAKANPGKVNYGAGTLTTQLGGELLNEAAGIGLAYIPYKGSAPTVQALLSGEIDVIVDGVTGSAAYLKTGKLRALANMGQRPIAMLPEVPTLEAAGVPGVDFGIWAGMVAPAGTPMEVVAKLHREVARILALPDVREKLLAAGMEPTPSTSAEFAALMRQDTERWRKVIKRLGIKLD